MAITAGNYIIRSALGKDTIILTSGGSKSKGASIISGGLIETDNRCYWKVAVVSSTYNRIYNLQAGNGNGNIMASKVIDGNSITQGAYKAATGDWLAVDSGNTIVVNGATVGTFFLKAKTDQTLYLTVPDDGGQLFLTTEYEEDTSLREFYFESTTYVNPKLATPKELTTSDEKDYIIDSSGGTASIKARWKCSSTNPIYEQRYCTRLYDPMGIPGEWSDWSNWTMITATKKTINKVNYMETGTNIPTPAIDNTDYIQADIQIEERLTSAAKASAYNKTGSVTHGPSVSGVIRKWITPTFTISESAVCKQYGLSIGYSSDYTISGNKIVIEEMFNGATELLVSNYILTNQDYEGEIEIPWNSITQIPEEDDTIVMSIKITESNGVVSTSGVYSALVEYDSSIGLAFTPEYSITNRMTIEGKIADYNSVECYIRKANLEGFYEWSKVEEIISLESGYRYFEIIPPYNEAPTIMWVVETIVNGVRQWGYKRETLSNDYILQTNYYTWNWIDDYMIPHVYILKYHAGSIMNPNNVITLPATEFVTTGRDYPVFRYSKSVKRKLDIDGIILNDEADIFCTKEIAESLGIANHTVYRQPDGKWYQTALKTVSFGREEMFVTVSIEQEAESR